MSTFAEKLAAACDEWMALSQTPREYEIGNCRGGFEAGARAALRLAAEECNVRYEGWSGREMLCLSADELRTLASTLEGGT